MLRHWRGELPLPVSYWGVAFSVGAANTAFALIPDWESGLASFPKITAWAMLLGAAAHIVAGLWVQVGIWRSAGNYLASGGTTAWGYIAKVSALFGSCLVVLLPFFTPQYPYYGRIAAGRDPNGAYVISQFGTMVEFKGGLAHGSAKALRLALEKDPKIKSLKINSAGGSLREGRAMRDLVVQRGLSTTVDGICLSACTLVYAAGTKRWMTDYDVLGFHAYRLVGFSPLLKGRLEEADREDWKARDFNAKFIDRAFKTPHDEFWMPTPDELLEAGFATNVVSFRHDGWDELDEYDQELIKHPLPRALMLHNPRYYREFSAITRAGIGAGTPVEVIRGRTKHLAAAAFAQTIPLTSSGAVRDVISYNADLLAAVEERTPEACAGTTIGEPYFQGIASLPPEYSEREAVLIARVIGDAVRSPRPAIGMNVRRKAAALVSAAGKGSACSRLRAVLLSALAKPGREADDVLRALAGG